jgi:hypothetical protein
MVAYALARRVALVLVATLVATSVGAPSAYAVGHDHAGVGRLWSKFPLGPRLRTSPATQQQPAHPRPTPPPTPSASARADTSVRVTPSESRHIAWWVWTIIAGAAAVVVATIAWLHSRRRSRGAAPLGGPARPLIAGRPPSGAPTVAVPAQPAGSVPPEKHPWLSAVPRTVDTLPRADLFAMANAVGVENTLSMSREELVEVLSISGPAAGAGPSPSDHELALYAAAYVAAARVGNPAPILAATALVPPTSDEPAPYVERMVVEARRRGLLTSHGSGKCCGDLTARGRALLRDPALQRPPSAR